MLHSFSLLFSLQCEQSIVMILGQLQEDDEEGRYAVPAPGSPERKEELAGGGDSGAGGAAGSPSGDGGMNEMSDSLSTAGITDSDLLQVRRGEREGDVRRGLFLCCGCSPW
jgi:hypothetical protein